MNWYLDVLKKYTVFEGRASRTEYWMFVLFNFLISIAVGIVGGILDIEILGTLYMLAVFIPVLAVVIRRLHDTGKSGWWLLLALIPIFGLITLIVFLCLDSQSGTNQFGSSVKGDIPQSTFGKASVKTTKTLESSMQQEVVINDTPTTKQNDIVVSPQILEEKS